MYESWFCTTPDISGLAGSIRLISFSFGIADVLLHELRLGQPDRLDGVRGEEAVLHVEEGRLRRLGGAAADQAEVAGLLGVAGEDHAPAAVGDRHHVVVAGVDVEALAGQGAGADVHDDRQALAGDGVQHLLHQHQALAGGEVGDAAAGDGEAFADGGGRVLAFRLEEHQRVAPQVLVAVHDGGVEAAAHRGRAGDRVGPRRLGDVDLDVDDGLGAVAGGRNARILELGVGGFAKGVGGAAYRSGRYGAAHVTPFLWPGGRCPGTVLKIGRSSARRVLAAGLPTDDRL